MSKIFVVALLVFSQCFGNYFFSFFHSHFIIVDRKGLLSTWYFSVTLFFLVSHAATNSISWVFRGTAQSNNTVLSFNQGDTLDLACRGISDTAGRYFVFTITRGSKAPSAISSSTSLGSAFTVTYTDAGTVIYNDVEGVKAGYENFVVIRFQNSATASAGVELLRLGVGLLRTQDAGTYHCSGITLQDTTPLLTSGGLTINVYTKQGQAGSGQTSANKLITYSALMVGASKLLF